MKVGTDGVLIGAWAGLRPGDRQILDIGTGTGLIALMLAQRTEGFGTEDDAAAHPAAPAIRPPLSSGPQPEPDRHSLRTDDTAVPGNRSPACATGAANDTGRAVQAAIPTEQPFPAADGATGRPEERIVDRTADDAADRTTDRAPRDTADETADRTADNAADRTADRAIRGVRITGIDIGDVSQACENAAASPWGDRVEFVRCPVQAFRPDRRYDLIVSNPPFFVDSLTSPDAERTTARHAVKLPFEALRDAVVRLLTEEGRFAVVLPSDEAARFERICRGALFASRRTAVRTTPRKAPKRMLLEFVRQAPDREIPTGELTIGTGAHETYTPEYRALTGDFYLKF